MDIDSEALRAPESVFPSSPPDIGSPEPTLPPPLEKTIANTISRSQTVGPSRADSSSDPISKERGNFSFPKSARATPVEPQGKRQRTEQARDLPSEDMFGPTFTPSTENKAQDLIYRARDLLIEAYSASTNRTQQTNILELVQVFREYTESGVLRKASNILATQVASLERATRKVETLARPVLPRQPQAPQATQATQSSQASQNPQASQNIQIPPSYAQIAKSTSSNTSWTIVKTKEQAKAKQATSQKAKELAKSKEKDSRLILLKSTISGSLPFSPLRLRNAINDAFKKAGQSELVVKSIAKTLAENIVVSTTETFSAQFLLDHKLVWEHIIPHKEAKRDQTYYKVAIHGIPLIDFGQANGLDLIKEEITTFNKGLDPVSTYWLTKQAKRQDPLTRFGSIVVAFTTPQEASRAIRQRLYIAGTSVKVVPFLTTPPSVQCSNCQGFGHLEAKCLNTLACGLCASNSHKTFQHTCTECTTKGLSCKHLVPKCTNCKGPHIASSLSCEIRQSLFRTSL
jgi:hypothetical protein